VAVRKRGILLDNGKAKGYDAPTEVNDGESFAHPISRGELKAANVLTEGKADEHERTDDDQTGEETAKDHLSCDPQHDKKEKLIEQLPDKIASVYMQQLKNLASFREPFVYDQSKPVYQNVVNHLFKAKQRGDFILNSRQNMHTYRTMIDPNYRYQMALKAMRGTLPQMDPIDKSVQLYGNDIFDTLQNFGGKHG
jgi:hypothetical protein